MPFENPTDDQLRGLLQTTRTIAVVGLSPRPDRPSYQVARAMQDFGYRVIPIRPATAEVLGETAYPDLTAAPVGIDLVDVFRAPEHVGPIVDAAIAIGARAIWLQEGVVNEAEAERARTAGLVVVMDRCIWKDYLRVVGSGQVEANKNP